VDFGVHVFDVASGQRLTASPVPTSGAPTDLELACPCGDPVCGPDPACPPVPVPALSGLAAALAGRGLASLLGRPAARRLRVAIACLAVIATAGIARADLSDRIDSLVRDEMARQRIPGVALAVVQRGKVIKAQGYGHSNVEHGVAVTAETIFQSGSLGKQFTAALVMLLVEDGRLELDDSVRDYLQNAPESWQAITIRHLLTHTSGVPE
jgi:CubicO group peptidase (beta-lactamase class C family)